MTEILYRQLLIDLIALNSSNATCAELVIGVADISRRAYDCIMETTAPWDDVPLVNPQLPV